MISETTHSPTKNVLQKYSTDSRSPYPCNLYLLISASPELRGPDAKSGQRNQATDDLNNTHTTKTIPGPQKKKHGQKTTGGQKPKSSADNPQTIKNSPQINSRNLSDIKTPQCATPSCIFTVVRDTRPQVEGLACHTKNDLYSARWSRASKVALLILLSAAESKLLFNHETKK